jgi:hypothetical protein
LKLQATAITINDFTKLNTTGICVDSKGNAFTGAVSTLQTYTNDTAMVNYIAYLGVRSESNNLCFHGFNHWRLTNKLACPKTPPDHLSWI